MCGDNQKTLLDEWGLLVSNGRIVESGVQGEVCTTYEGVVTLDDGSAAAEFTADAHLVFDQATIDANKYYTNVALTKNVDKKLADISSIPASFTWSRTNTTDFRGVLLVNHIHIDPTLNMLYVNRERLSRPGTRHPTS